jgi:hypothetical protein
VEPQDLKRVTSRGAEYAFEILMRGPCVRSELTVKPVSKGVSGEAVLLEIPWQFTEHGHSVGPPTA